MRRTRLWGSCGFAVAGVALGVVLGGCDKAGAPVTPENSIRARQPTRDPSGGSGGPGAPGTPAAPGGGTSGAPGNGTPAAPAPGNKTR